MRTLIRFAQINIAMQTNAFLYYFSRIPVFGRLFKESWFRAYRAKKLFAVFGIALHFIKEALGTNIGLYIILCFFPNILLKGREVNGSEVLFLFLMVNCVAGSVSGHGLFAPRSEDYTFLTHFMVNPDSYYKYKAFKNVLSDTVLYIPVLLFITRSIMLTLLMISIKLLFVMVSGTGYLQYFKKHHKIPGKAPRNIGLLLCVVLAYLGIYFEVISEFTLSTAAMAGTMAVSVIGAIAGCVYHARYKEYKKMAIVYANLSTVQFQVSVQAAAVGEDSMGLKDGDWKENKDFFADNKELEPWAYFEKAFRCRYRKPLLMDRLSWLLLMLAAALILVIVVRIGWLTLSGKNIFEYTPIILAFATLSSFAGRLMQMFFRNIDVFILDGKFATREYVQQSMMGRYLYVMKGDVMYALVFLGLVAFTDLMAGLHLGLEQQVKIGLLFALFLFLWDTYQIIIYYLIQPFSKDMAVKNPVYNALGWLEGIFSLAILFVRQDITRGLPMLLALDVFMVFVLLIVRRHAWRTFRLR